MDYILNQLCYIVNTVHHNNIIMKKRKIFTSVLLFIALLAILFFNAYNTAVYLQSAPVSAAAIRLVVVDGKKGTPVHNACVCIAETGAYFYTDNNGNTPLIEVPIIINSNYDGIVKRDFGEITILIFKEGYIDYILLNLAVKENENRQGIRIMLYEKEEGAPDYFSIVETPDGSWIKKLIERYKK